ncbi:sigma-70 family RNA polymerase sigma factor [Blastochloris sulfoviridis]|uniref:Sigma-70 family RNA polymerase sigma factor n=1 Tax=Blastochloris sulfoviridis TaxID=50712 RepID=A0A5M6I2H9_9HYPH|nr:sigma-70 family RNA polymerase sigma factor [Blastochloris sulfoviridis]KAA5601988.1 sigma-70 family RNA polymerase sigma factor [Blastochloris sulfoviridis]
MTADDRERQWADWMVAGLGGDEAAYRRLLTALAPALRGKVRRALARWGVPDADAEDIVQDALLAIHLKRHTWRREDAIGPWIEAIARYKLVDALRRRGRRGEVPIDGLGDFLPGDDDPAENLGRRDAERLVDRLGGTQGRIVRAVAVEGTSIRDTAQSLGMNEGAVRVALHRGLKTLSKLYRVEP